MSERDDWAAWAEEVVAVVFPAAAPKPAHPDLLEDARRQGKAIDDVDRQIQECKRRLAEIDRLLGEG